MPKRSLLWLLFPVFAVAAALATLLAGWLAISQCEENLLGQTRGNLRALADFLDAQLGVEIPADRQDFARFCRRYDQASKVRITLLLPNGNVDCDSRNRADEFEDQLHRPEILQALAGGMHDTVRYNAALDRRVMYLASPVFRHDRLFGVLYLSTPLEVLDAAAARLRLGALVATGAALALALALAAWTARYVSRATEPVRHAAGRLADGQWQTRVTLADSCELAELGAAFNHMAETLQRQIAMLVRNNNEQKAVLASMAEGVLAVDRQERVISMNRASGRLLGLDPAQAQGRRLQEVVRNADLSRFITRASDSPEPIEDDVLLHGDRQRVMQAHGSALYDLEGSPIGAVVVLNDVTDFRRLEHIRRDFVANVSHELKTPITSIKGFAETLLDGAAKDPVNTERFLRIVAKQADRLHAIIEDLLSLSKIEQSEDADDIVLEVAPIHGVLESAVNTCQTAAREREIAIKLDCPSELTAKINAVLLEQAIVNLLDNAIKYSESGREVFVTAAEAPDAVTITIADHGCGIASEHLSRIFERFYRVDPARSRKLGGTGLGLSIVKHIVQAHKGQVSVESTLGSGSTFTIRLPAQ